MAKHSRGWQVNQPESKSVSYPTRRQARRVSKQLTGSSVSRPGCLLGLFLLPLSRWVK